MNTSSPDLGFEPCLTSSLEEFAREQRPHVYRSAYRLTGDRDAAEDLTQDVFVRVLRAMHTYRPGARPESLDAWLRRITVNLFLDDLRRQRRIRIGPLMENTEAQLPGSEPGPAEQYEARELDHQLSAALHALAPSYRAAVVLRDLDDLSYAQIAELLDVNQGTVRSRIHRGRHQLRTRLEQTRRLPGQIQPLSVKASESIPAGA